MSLIRPLQESIHMVGLVGIFTMDFGALALPGFTQKNAELDHGFFPVGACRLPFFFSFPLPSLIVPPFFNFLKKPGIVFGRRTVGGQAMKQIQPEKKTAWNKNGLKNPA